MVETLLPVPSLLGGITQQPAPLARPDKVKDSQNVLPLPETGMSRRGPLEHRAVVTGAPAPQLALLPVNRGGEDRYPVVLGHDLVKAYHRNGTEIEIKSVTRDSAGLITGGGAPDFDYLDLRTFNRVVDPETFIESGPWASIGDAQNAQIGNGPISPLGWPDDGLGQGFYASLIVDAGGTTGTWVQAVGSHLWNGLVKVSTYFRTDAPGVGGGPPDFVLVDTINLGLQDPAGGGVHSVTFDFSGGAPTDLPVVTGNTGDFIVLIDQDPEGNGNLNEFRLGFIFDPARVVIGSVGNTIQVAITLGGIDAGDDSGIFAWGCQLEFEGDPTTFGPYAQPPEVLRSIPVNDSTYVANPLVPTRLTAAISQTFAQVYGSVLFEGISTPADDVTAPVFDAGFVFARLAEFEKDYSVRIKLTDTLGAGGDVFLAALVTTITGQGTTNIIEELTDALNADVLNTSAPDATPTRILKASNVAVSTSNASVMKLETINNAGHTWEIAEIIVSDDAGDRQMIAFTDKAELLSDLPLVCQDGHAVSVGATDDPQGDYQPAATVIRFVATDSGAFGSGAWVEGTAYGVRTTPDPATLPHVLTRRQDDGAATVTGKAFALYFEWGPPPGDLLWSDRLVGEDGPGSNPVPSFITPTADEGTADRTVTGISFYRGRLALASRLNIAWSEVSRFGNFWRSTLQALPDSDRVDIVVSTPDMSPITDLSANGGTLYARSDRAVAAVAQTDVFGPRSVGIDTVFGDGTNSLAAGEPKGGGIFFPSDGSRHGGVEFLFRRDAEGTPTFASFDVSQDLPSRLDRNLSTLSWAGPLKLLLVHSRSEPTTLYALRLVSEGDDDPQQLAWAPLEAGGNKIHSVVALGPDLFVLVQRPAGIMLESIPLDEFQRDPGQTWTPLMDRRVSELNFPIAMAYAAGPDETTITLPYAVDPAATTIVVGRGAANHGTALTVKSASGLFVVVDGDATALQLYVGQTFTSWVKPLRPVIKDPAPVAGFIPRTSDDVTVSKAFVSFGATGDAEVIVELPDGTEVKDVHSSAVPEDVNLATAVACDDLVAALRIESSSFRPMNVTGLEWLLDVEPKAVRVRS